MHIRCPHCQNAVEVVGNEEFESVNCPSCGSAFELVPATISCLPSRRKIAHFELLDQLGTGGFGTVWKARDTKLDRFVALKEPRIDRNDREHAELFLREARAAAQLRHQHIVAVHEVGREDGTLYIVSDYIQGVTLSDRLTAGPFTPREAAALLATIADALHHAHEAGVIHRDLKPQNIMLDGDGQPKLMDFGLAKREAREVTMTIDGKILGTPAYMSPEQARGEGHRVDRRTDIYSLGVILFELLTGERPFRGNQRMLLHQVIREEPPSPRKLNGRISRDLETICLKCMEKEASKRYATASEVADELRRFLALKPIFARPVSNIERVWRWSRRHSAVSLLGAAAAIAAAVVLVGGLFTVAGGTFILSRFETMWIDQVVDDNNAVASAIAQATKDRLSDQMGIVYQESNRWREIFRNQDDDETAFQERIRREIQASYHAHNGKFDGWHVADSNGKILANFGDVARADKPKFEDTAINKQYGWRGWFNGERDRKDLSAQQRRDFPEPLAQEALIKRPSDLYCSAPYRRPVDGIWVIAISCRLTARDGQAPVGVLFGQFALEKFVDFIRHFESSAGYQRRKVVVANEMGQAMYHPRLKNPVDPTAAAMDEEGGAEDVPEVSPKSKDYEYFLKTAFSSDDDSAETRARTDPWDAKPGETYFVGSEVISLDMGRIRRGEEGQKLAVFVFHQKDRALQGFMRAKWTILLLGFGVLLVASVLFVAVLLGLRLATRLESLTSSS